MITSGDLQFHIPADVGHDWAETYYLDILVPEAGLRGFVYLVFRAGVGAVACDVQFWDTASAAPHDALYVDVQNHLPLPERMEAFTLPNGLSFAATSPTEYRIDYAGYAGTEIHLTYEGVAIPYDIHDPEIDPRAETVAEAAIENSGFGAGYANHFDLTARARGEVVVRGRRHAIDRVVTVDHSWGPRPERGMRTMAWVNANFEDRQFHAIWKVDVGGPEITHAFAHGYAVIDGQLRGGVDGALTVERDGVFGNRYTMTVVDRDGREHMLEGHPLTNHVWYAYACCPTPVAMVEWRDAEGRVGYGTAMEALPFEALAPGRLGGSPTPAGATT